jgi:hypothetical protein
MRRGIFEFIAFVIHLNRFLNGIGYVTLLIKKICIAFLDYAASNKRKTVIDGRGEP